MYDVCLKETESGDALPRDPSLLSRGRTDSDKLSTVAGGMSYSGENGPLRATVSVRAVWLFTSLGRVFMILRAYFYCNLNGRTPYQQLSLHDTSSSHGIVC